MKQERLLKILDSFQDKKICVLGDLMADQYIWGDTDRISPEAPVPVIYAKHELVVPGGAGNVAVNAASLGAETFVLGVIGQDRAGVDLMKEFQTRGINTAGVVPVRYRPTTQKIRIMARGQQIVRIDKESLNYIGYAAQNKILKYFSREPHHWDGIIFSDYDKGLVTELLARRVIALARKYQKPIIADVKPKNAHYFKKVTLLTPNAKEAFAITGADNIRNAGRMLQKKFLCNTLITQGDEGMTLFAGKQVKHLPTKAKEVYDVTGAGDTVAAVLALALTAGATLYEAASLANHAAGIVVGKRGTTSVSLLELKQSLKEAG